MTDINNKKSLMEISSNIKCTNTNKILPKRTKIGAKLPDHTNRPSPFSGSLFLNPKRTYFSTNQKKNNTISTPQSTLNQWSHEKNKQTKNKKQKTKKNKNKNKNKQKKNLFRLLTKFPRQINQNNHLAEQ
jgi:hypothetical protein